MGRGGWGSSSSDPSNVNGSPSQLSFPRQDEIEGGQLVLAGAGGDQLSILQGNPGNSGASRTYLNDRGQRVTVYGDPSDPLGRTDGIDQGNGVWSYPVSLSDGIEVRDMSAPMASYDTISASPGFGGRVGNNLSAAWNGATSWGTALGVAWDDTKHAASDLLFGGLNEARRTQAPMTFSGTAIGFAQQGWNSVVDLGKMSFDAVHDAIPPLGALYDVTGLSDWERSANAAAHITIQGDRLWGRAAFEGVSLVGGVASAGDLLVARAGATVAANSGTTQTFFHATSDSAVDRIMTGGFRTDLPNPVAAFHNNRFGPGVYVSNSPAAALAERSNSVVLKLEADIGKNLDITGRGPIYDGDMAKAIARGARKQGYNSVTTLSVQKNGGANTVIFDPARVRATQVVK